MDGINEHDATVLLCRQHSYRHALGKHIKIPAWGSFRQHIDHDQQQRDIPGGGKVLPVGNDPVLVWEFSNQLPVHRAED